jgi:hypothetical protein
MTQPSNGHALPLPQHKQPLPNGHPSRYTGERLLRTRPRTYQKIVALLADPTWSVNRIAQVCKVGEHSVVGVREREASTIEERKKRLTSVLVDVATLGAEAMERKIGKSSLRDATIATGVATDKVLALQGKSPVGIQIANITMPSEEERERLRRRDRALDEITRLLHKPEPLTTKEELMIKAQLHVLSSGQDADE